jgi:hypothetical protein
MVLIDYINNFEIQKSIVPAEFFDGNKGELQVAFGTKHSMNSRVSLSQLAILTVPM